jgi:DNA-binding FrmR family transcriptional regulator
MGYVIAQRMAHTTHEKDQLVLRIKRIRGQLNAAEKALEEERECTDVLQMLTACKGAVGSLIAEVLEGHIYSHVLKSEKKPHKDQIEAAEELISIIKTYLR